MELTLPKLLEILKRNIAWLIISAIIFALLTFGYSYGFLSPSYTNQMKLIVEYPEGISDYTDITLMRRMVVTYIDILNTTDYALLIKQNCDTSLSVNEIKASMEFTSFEESEAFILKVTCKTPEDCQKITETVSKTVKTHIDNFYGYKLSLATIESPPSIPTEVGIPFARNTLVGALLGALLAGCYAVVRSLYDISVKSEDDLAQHYDIPILGTVPDFTAKRRSNKSRKKAIGNEK